MKRLMIAALLLTLLSAPGALAAGTQTASSPAGWIVDLWQDLLSIFQAEGEGEPVGIFEEVGPGLVPVGGALYSGEPPNDDSAQGDAAGALPDAEENVGPGMVPVG
ncbi:MAG: hypothetical protein AAF725_11815 [Acidobacteriota bacterium]